MSFGVIVKNMTLLMLRDIDLCFHFPQEVCHAALFKVKNNVSVGKVASFRHQAAVTQRGFFKDELLLNEHSYTAILSGFFKQCLLVCV